MLSRLPLDHTIYGRQLLQSSLTVTTVNRCNLITSLEVGLWLLFPCKQHGLVLTLTSCVPAQATGYVPLSVTQFSQQKIQNLQQLQLRKSNEDLKMPK